MAIAVVQKALSIASFFLFGLALRNMLKMNYSSYRSARTRCVDVGGVIDLTPHTKRGAMPAEAP